MRLALCGTIKATAGQGDELLAVLLEAAHLLAADPECVQYTVGTAGDDEVGVFELWETEEAHAASLQREEIQAVITRGRPLIAGMGTSIRFHVGGPERASR